MRFTRSAGLATAPSCHAEVLHACMRMRHAAQELKIQDSSENQGKGGDNGKDVARPERQHSLQAGVCSLSQCISGPPFPKPSPTCRMRRAGTMFDINDETKLTRLAERNADKLSEDNPGLGLIFSEQGLAAHENAFGLLPGELPLHACPSHEAFKQAELDFFCSPAL